METKEKPLWTKGLTIRIERWIGEFFLIIGSLVVFKGVEPYLDTLKLSDFWWIILGSVVVALAVNRLVSYERKMKMFD